MWFPKSWPAMAFRLTLDQPKRVLTMSEPLTGLRPAFGTSDAMSAFQFEEELRHVARFDPQRIIENPLAAAVQKIRDNPAFAQSRLLGRIVTALTYQRGEFRRAEASALDTATLGLVIALMNAHRAGATPSDDWINAAKAVSAAYVDGDA
jgi:hypothetical protein